MSAPLDLANLFSAKGMVALVTGGGTGIGMMMAKALAEAGAHRVYIVGRRVEVLQEAAATINKPGVVVPLYCDVTSKISLESVVSVVEKDVGYLNLLVCNSGIGGPQVAPPTAETTLAEWREKHLAIDVEDFTQTFRVNASAVWYTTIAFLALLDAGNKKGNVEQSSHIVTTSSIAAFNKKAPGGWAYGQSKAAAVHLTKQLANTLIQWNIRANSIAPGLFPSEMANPILASIGCTPENPVLARTSVPMGRTGNDNDMAGAMLYLASKAGAYLNGNAIVVDGGRLGMFPSTW